MVATPTRPITDSEQSAPIDRAYLRAPRVPADLAIDWSQSFDDATCDEYDPDHKAAIIEIARRAFLRSGGECSVQGCIEDAICGEAWR